MGLSWWLLGLTWVRWLKRKLSRPLALVASLVAFIFCTIHAFGPASDIIDRAEYGIFAAVAAALVIVSWWMFRGRPLTDTWLALREQPKPSASSHPILYPQAIGWDNRLWMWGAEGTLGPPRTV